MRKIYHSISEKKVTILLNEMNHPNSDNHPEGTTFEQM